MRPRKNFFFKMLVLVGIIGFIGLSNQINTKPIQSEHVHILPSSAAINQTNTNPASGGYLFQNISSTLAAGLRDESSLNRAYEGGSLAINKSGSPFANYNLLPAGSYDDCYDSFSNDPIHQFPDGYTILGGTGAYLEVSASYLGHAKVLNITATQNTAEFTGVRFPASSTSGNFSCWICVDKTWTEAYSYCPILASMVTNFAIMNGNFQYWPGSGGWTNTGVVAAVNYWYHIRVSFTPTQLKWYVNDVLIATVGVSISVSNFELGVTPNLGTPYTTYYDAIDVDYDGTYDLRNTIDMSPIGVYNGTDSFENYSVFAFPEKWSESSGVGCRSYVVPTADGHKNVLCLTDSSGTDLTSASQNFPAKTAGRVAFWTYLATTGYYVWQTLDSTGGYLSCLDIQSGNLHAYTTGAGDITVMAMSTNTWYYMEISFNAGTWDLYVNGLLKQSGLGYYSSSSNDATCFGVRTGGTPQGIFYLDAVDFSWDPEYYANRSTFALLQRNITFSTLGSYAFQYTLNSSGINYPGEWTLFTVAIPNASAPQSLIAINATYRVDLTWQPPAWEGWGPITNYTIYRGTASGTETFYATLGNVTSFSDTGATSRITPYFYKVSANNSFGEGNLSEEVNGDPLFVPDTPGNFLATAGNQSINLTWTAPVETGGTWITNYTLYRRTYLESVCTFLIAFDNTTLTYNNTGLTNGVAYYYQISANNSAGEGSKTVEVTEIPRTFPGAPRNVVVNATGNGWIYLTWQPPASIGGSPIIEYRVYRGTTSGGEESEANVGTLLYYNDTGQINGVKYYYHVTAINGVGEGPASDECWGIPTLPLLVQATATGTGIELSWNELSYITSYAIYRFTSQDEDYQLWSPIGTTSQLRFIDALDVAQSVYYQVLGYNADGDLVVVSDPVPITYNSPTPIDPTLLLIPGVAVAGVVVALLIRRSRHSKPKLSHQAVI